MKPSGYVWALTAFVGLVSIAWAIPPREGGLDEVEILGAVVCGVAAIALAMVALALRKRGR